jgi:hypothetical protein
VPAKGQHLRPCSDCPWRRDALPGWLGGSTARAWVSEAHGDGVMDCHVLIGAQCVGAATYRANVVKAPRDPRALRAEKDKGRVFATPQEFIDHHEGDA